MSGDGTLRDSKTEAIAPSPIATARERIENGLEQFRGNARATIANAHQELAGRSVHFAVDLDGSSRRMRQRISNHILELSTGVQD